jgi:HEAT repeat protein/TolB-like protein
MTIKRLLLTLIAAFLIALPSICHAQPISIAVLPLANETGDPSLDWLSVGLQDAMTVDLYYANGLNAVALPHYTVAARKNLRELTAFSKHEALWLGSIIHVDQVWYGFFRRQGRGMELELRGLDVRTERESFGMVVSAQLDSMLSAESALVVSALDKIGFELTEAQKNMILSPKTGSIQAFELNAKGYEVQQRLSLSKSRSKFYGEWVRLLKGAVAEDPAYAEAWVNLGWALYTSDDMKGALKAFTKARKLKPYLADANMGMGYVMRDYKRDYTSAIEYMAKAVEINSGLEWINKDLIITIVKAEDKTAIPYILKLLNSERKSLRIAAIEALGSFRDASSLTPLGKVIDDSDEEVQYAAIRAIGMMGTDAAIPYLESALQSDYSKVEIVQMILAINEEAGIPHLIAMLKDTSTEDCVFAARELGIRGAVQAVPDLIEAVGEFEALSHASLRALADIGDIDAMPAIIAALKDEREGVRVVAAAILGDYEAVDAKPALWEMARTDAEPLLRLRALISLALIGDDEAIAQLAEVLRGDDQEKARYVLRRVLQRPDKFIGTELEFVFVNDTEA